MCVPVIFTRDMEDKTNDQSPQEVTSEVSKTEVQEAKPKRVLTEAQRLAFIKGREKRLANLERKRQEKLEAEQSVQPTEERVSTTEPKLPQVDPPPIPVLKRQTNAEKPPSASLDDHFAKKVVEMLYSKFNEEAIAEEEPPPKRKYTRRAKPVEQAKPPTPPVPPPQKTFNWM